MKNKIKDIKSIQIKFFPEERGELSVIEKNDLPFQFKRVFTIKANKGDVRGDHAHKECKQFMMCLNGEVEISCDDGKQEVRYKLNKSNKGIMVPNHIWSKQKYLIKNSVLMVLCDLDYDENDYIRNYPEFIEYLEK